MKINCARMFLSNQVENFQEIREKKSLKSSKRNKKSTYTQNDEKKNMIFLLIKFKMVTSSN